MPQGKVRKIVQNKPALYAVPKKPSWPRPETKYVELISNRFVSQFSTPTGPGYPVVFDEVVDVAGWKEVRVWVHVFVEDYKATPIDISTARLQLRFMHNFSGNSFGYEEATFHTTVTSYINGFASKPIIGNTLRLFCHPENLPAGPYTISVTYLLI
jgi:hypothetical protein